MTHRQIIYLLTALVLLFLSLIIRSVISPAYIKIDRPVPQPLPYSQNLPLPDISAKHVFILDLDSQQVLYQKQSDDRIYPASTTKMMTALVALENYSLSQPLTVSKSYPIGQNAGFLPGEILTVEQLLYAMLVNSANDAAEILAENVLGGRPAFIFQMNVYAEKLRLANTRFSNPTGMDEDNHYSSAADLTRLAEAILNQPYLAKIVSTENVVINSNHSPRVLASINQLLGKVPGVLGIKTGFTDLAGQSLVTLVKRNDHSVIITVLGSQDRFSDSAALIEWVYSNFIWSTG